MGSAKVPTNEVASRIVFGPTVPPQVNRPFFPLIVYREDSRIRRAKTDCELQRTFQDDPLEQIHRSGQADLEQR